MSILSKARTIWNHHIKEVSELATDHSCLLDVDKLSPLTRFLKGDENKVLVLDQFTVMVFFYTCKWLPWHYLQTLKSLPWDHLNRIEALQSKFPTIKF